MGFPTSMQYGTINQLHNAGKYDSMYYIEYATYGYYSMLQALCIPSYIVVFTV